MTSDPIAIPDTRYARAGDLHIAYQVFGAGPIDLVFVDQWFSNVDAMWDFPPLARLLNQLATFSRVIVFDKRGTGLSDPIAVDALPTIEEWIDDIRAVLDDVGSERTALLSGVGASIMALVPRADRRRPYRPSSCPRMSVRTSIRAEMAAGSPSMLALRSP